MSTLEALLKALSSISSAVNMVGIANMFSAGIRAPSDNAIPTARPKASYRDNQLWWVSTMKKVKARRGTKLVCKGWRQEAILRMLQNNLEHAEKPDELIIYGGTGKAARDWKC